MSERQLDLRSLLMKLVDEGVVEKDAPALTAFLARMSAVQPWYIRTMVGFGAWIASLLLIGFVSSMGLAVDGGFAVFGVFFLGGAIYLRKVSSNDFSIQSALAAGLAGQALIVIGVMELIDWDDLETGFGLVAMLNVVLFVIFPDRIYRVLSILLAVGSVVVLFYIREWNALVPAIGPLLALGMIIVTLRGAKLLPGSKGIYLRPLQSGLMLSAFGCLLASTVYVLPEIGVSFQFYPRPWISTIMLGAMLIYVLSKAWADLLAGMPVARLYSIVAIVVLIIAASWLAPGLVLSLIVIVLGSHTGHRSMIGAGIAFFAVFLATYFYGIQVSMLEKSITLVSSGVAVLFARWFLLRLILGETQGG
jgi:uncharacterized membrane protein